MGHTITYEVSPYVYKPCVVLITLFPRNIAIGHTNQPWLLS